ncbi:MAG: RDD family protein [Candidatus Aenigmatarchaeota archaeon]
MPQQNYAGFWIRFAAAIIDGIFESILPIIGLLINIYLVGEKGYSIGKKVLGLKIIKENGKCPIGLVDALIREVIGKFVSSILLGIGFLIIGFNPKKQGLHDMIAKTYVVYEK